MTQTTALSQKILTATVIVTSLSNFIDMFDLFLFNMVRVKSLMALGLSGSALTDAGLLIANAQWAGLLIGAYVWGVVGDRLGRKSSLLCSILIYSLGSLGSSFVTDIHTYMLARFITGLGIAGELGAGITLISERLVPQRRGYGIMVFIVVGFLGLITAALLTEFLPWRTAYQIGGGTGLALLLTRTLLRESGMFTESAGLGGVRGGLRLILHDRRALVKYASAILVLATGVFIPQIVWTLSPELGKAKGLTDIIKPNIVLAVGFGSAFIVDMVAAALSEILRSRKKAVLICLALGFPCFLIYLASPVRTLAQFYAINSLVGIGFGAWVVACAWAAENFGTNIRATVATTSPNFARALSILMNISYWHLKTRGALFACGVIGTVIFVMAFIGWCGLAETWGKDLDYFEPEESS